MKNRVFKLSVVTGVLLLAACDSSPDKDRQIDVTPDSVELNQRAQSVVFEATMPPLDPTQEEPPNRELVFPLTWTVANENLGRILSSEGTRAVYVRSGIRNGSNVVIVNDQAGREGLASVNQVSAPSP